MTRSTTARWLVLALPLALSCVSSVTSKPPADEVRVAVAANFLGPAQALAESFERDTGYRVIISSGSTGTLYAHIVNGAPYDVFLAANRREPERLEQGAHIREGSRFTYARGVLVLWYRGTVPDDVAGPRSALALAAEQRIAIANPATAPYGEAAAAVLSRWGQLDNRTTIRGESVAQAYQFVATGNTEVGFVALSQMLDPDRPPDGHFWRVDEQLYPSIEQQAVILKRAAENPTALAFWRYLKSEPSRERIVAFGYELE